MHELVISSPGKKNALTTSMLEALVSQLARAAGDPVLLTGEGDAFSAGLDLSEVASLDANGARRLLSALEQLVESLYTYPAPTVALVNGHAIAGGCVLALCCDYRVSTPDARVRIGLNEVALGLLFPPRTLAMVRAQLGMKAERVVLGARLMDPAGALEAGLIDELADDPRAAALAWLEARARCPRGAYASTKADLRAHALEISEMARQRFEEEALPRWISAETKATLARFLKQ